MTVPQLIDSHDLFLIDAYGVLMTSAGPLPGAVEFMRALASAGKEYFVVTNDASRTVETCAAVYLSRGMEIPVERILSAGLAISVAFERDGLRGSRTAVLGTDETRECCERAGGVVVEIKDSVEFDVLVIGDDSGFAFLPTMNALLTSLHRMTRAGRIPRLFLANPDLLYPRGAGAFGFTSGAVARFLEIGLRDLHPSVAFSFEVLGKPSPLLFDLARSRVAASPSRTAMLGDQLHTDIAGANRAGIHSALLATGITQLPLASDLIDAHKPTYVLESLLA